MFDFEQEDKRSLLGRIFGFGFENRKSLNRPLHPQDGHHGVHRARREWTGPPIGVKQLDSTDPTTVATVVTIAIIGGLIRHIALQFWSGLDVIAFGTLILTSFAVTFREYDEDDARYGTLHSVTWLLAFLFILGRLIFVHLGLYRSSLPGLAS